MNNRGFAITTILFGIMILFMLLFVSLLGILSTYRSNLEKLIENNNGARSNITFRANKEYATFEELKASSNAKRGLYCFSSDNTCRYVSNSNLK